MARKALDTTIGTAVVIKDGIFYVTGKIGEKVLSHDNIEFIKDAATDVVYDKIPRLWTSLKGIFRGNPQPTPLSRYSAEYML
jgi:hypothetical protein